jgi:hypothetical protein
MTSINQTIGINDKMIQLDYWMLDFHLFKLFCFIRLSCNEMKHGIKPYSLTVAIEKNVRCILARMKLNYGNVLGNVSDNSCPGFESIWV